LLIRRDCAIILNRSATRAIRFPTGSADQIDLRPADELASCEWRTAGGVFDENNIR